MQNKNEEKKWLDRFSLDYFQVMKKLCLMVIQVLLVGG
jgi:hypothetical protein